MEVYKTDLQRQREMRNYALYSDYQKMMSVQGQSATEVTKVLMKKYNLHSPATVYVIRNKVEQELQRKEANNETA
jgi:hypothetical protein